MSGTESERSGWFEPERAASQRDLEILRQRIDYIDANGTRGVGIVSSQVQFLTAGLAELKTSTALWQGHHERQHTEDIRTAVSGRRWLIGTGIAALVMLVAMLTLMLQLAGKVG